VVLIVHGLGEHGGRYDGVAQRLNDWGFAVRGLRPVRPRRVEGPRGTLPSPDRLLADLADLVERTRDRLPEGVPLILLGHSMGGLVAARFVASGAARWTAWCCLRPRWTRGSTGCRSCCLRCCRALRRTCVWATVWMPTFISHDPDVVQAYLADPLVHDRISGRLARFIADAGPEVVARAPGWKVPTLLMYAGSDLLVNPAGSRAFGAAAPSQVVRAQCYPDLYHEIFNEVESQPVFDLLHDWLTSRF
jgi:alpha-beta hydrolase superfamily lysophospholipase